MKGFLYSMRVALAVICTGAALGATAADFYVSNNGDDSNDGRSHISAWRTVDKVNSANIPSGSNVYFRSGDVWHDQQLKVNWGGSASDPAEIDCYVVRSGAARVCRSSDPKPEINGSLEASCLADLSCTIHGEHHDGSSGPRSIPASRWEGLIAINASHVHVRNFRIRESAGAAIVTANSQDLRGFVFENLDVSLTANRLIAFGRDTRDMIVRNSTFSKYNYCDYGSADEGAWDICSGPGWPGGIFIWDAPNANALIENNTVTQGFGEGINCLQSSHVIIRGNRVGNLRSARIYLDNCSDTVVENNITWGDPDLNWHFTELGGTGVAVSLEKYKFQGPSVRNLIRNNIISGIGTCFSVAIQEEGDWRLGAEIYGNTCLHPTNYGINFSNKLTAENVVGMIVKNNIFYAPNIRSKECQVSSSVASVVDFGYNLFSSSSKSDSGCFGPGTVFDNPETPASPNDASRWSYTRQPRSADFALDRTSPAFSAGTSLLADIDHVSNIPMSNQTQSCTPDEQALSRDFNCQLRSDPPSLGALEPYVARPNPPVILLN